MIVNCDQNDKCSGLKNELGSSIEPSLTKTKAVLLVST